jgi:hypothetical protein
MENKLKRRQGVEGKKKKLKRRQGDEGKRRSREESPSQVDERVRLHDLKFIHPTSQPKPKICP